MASVASHLAQKRLQRPLSVLSSAYLGRVGFNPGTKFRVAIYHEPNEISYAQIYPFFHYASQIDARILARPVEAFLGGDMIDADVYVIQPWFTVDPSRLEAALTRLRARAPQARVVFIDSYAHNDLRLGRAIDPYIDLYLKKSLFKDRALYLKDWRGDTNLTEFYSDLYQIDADETAFDVPASLLTKLDLTPNFFTAPYLSEGFLTSPAPTQSGRSIDVHARIATKGSPWYSAMRHHADQAIKSIPGLTLTPEGRIPRAQFLEEMRQSKLCWSPFGYGELCWRDFEAFLTGSVLIKPDMGHLDTAPDLYRANETYLAVKWDFSNLEEVVTTALSDDALRHTLASNAFNACRTYLAGAQFPQAAQSWFKAPRAQAQTGAEPRSY